MSDNRGRSAELSDLIDVEPLRPGVRGDRAGQLHRLCDVLVEVLPASAAGLTVSVGDYLAVVLAASGPRAEEIEELQLTLGEGPCIDVERLSRPVLEPDLAGSGAPRWPAYGPAAGGLGVAAVFAFPMHVGATHLGVLDVYQPCAGELSHRALLDCLLFADIARNFVLEDLDRDNVDGLSIQWTDVLPIPEFYQAQGMLMIQLGAEPVDALARIRAYAFAHDERIGDVARDIVTGRLKLGRDES